MSVTRRALLSLALVVLVVAALPATATATEISPNWESDHIGDTYIYEQRMDVAAHNMSAMDSPLDYYDDSGEVATAAASLNESINNSLVLRADKIEDDDLSTYPRKSDESGNSASLLDHSEWSTTGPNASKISVTDADGSTAGGVPAIQIATDGTMGAGDEATASYANQTITTDATKRVAIIIGNVNTLDTATEGRINFSDADGDVVTVYLNSSESASAVDVFANGTGNGLLYQAKLADLTVSGSGDGTFDAIEYVNVTAVDGDLDLTITGFDAERKSKIVLGEEKVDTDSDDALETEAITEVATGGEQTIHSLASLDPIFDDAVIYDLGVKGVEWRASLAGSDDVSFDLSDADQYAGYAKKGDQYRRVKVVAAIDLTHTGLELRHEQALIDERYKVLEYVEGAGDTAFDDLSESSFVDVSGTVAQQGDDLVLDETIQPGETYVVHSLTVYLDSEVGDLEASSATPEPTGPGGFWDSGNPLAAFVNWILAGLAVVGGALGIMSRRGS